MTHRAAIRLDRQRDVLPRGGIIKADTLLKPVRAVTPLESATRTLSTTPFIMAEEDVQEAASTIKRKHKIDTAGHAGIMYELIPPRTIATILQTWVNNRSQTSKDPATFLNVIKGYARGGGTVTPAPDRIRVITSQNYARTILDIVVAKKLRSKTDARYKPDFPAFWEGGRPSTQVLDITLGLSLMVERGLDDRSNIGIATMDIRHYYDSLDIPKILRTIAGDMHDDGSFSFVQAILRIQCLTSLRIEGGPEVFDISPRAMGSLIGSRIVVALGRVPVLHCLEKLRDQLKFQGSPVSNGTNLAAATYVDNIYAVAPTGNGAVGMLNLLEGSLLEEWPLKIKGDSREYLIARGSPHIQR